MDDDRREAELQSTVDDDEATRGLEEWLNTEDRLGRKQLDLLCDALPFVTKDPYGENGIRTHASPLTLRLCMPFAEW